MAVAAYASLVSLTHVLDNLHDRVPFHLPLLDIKHVETLQEKVQFLLEFVEQNWEMETQEIKVLWRHIVTTAFEAEEMVDNHVVNLLYLRSQGETTDADFLTFCDDLDIMISKFDFTNKELPVIDEVCIRPPAFLPTTTPSATPSSGKNVVVGFDEHVVNIKDKLTRSKDHLQILSIVGMGGIGKTTLAKCVHNDPYIVNYFDKRIWLTISQQFNVAEILNGLLNVGGNTRCYESSVDVLGTKLYQELFGRKYLIIMDDMWSTEVWDELKRYFPNNGNGSRILVTTRLSNVASSLGSLNHYPIPFLDGDKSWDLFCQNAFAQIGCPYEELEKIGRDIAKSCRGLPLEISVIGRLLANSEMTPKYWGFVAENMSSFGDLDNEHCLKVLSLSYTSLPIHLKPCFLYLRVFREDESIEKHDLIKRWVAEGFIKQASEKSLEEMAEQYAQDLMQRNLIFIESQFRWDGWVHFLYGIHDLVRDLCLRESIKESFIQSPKIFNWQRLWLKKHINCMQCGEAKVIQDDEINFLRHNFRFPPSLRYDNLIVCDDCQKKYSHIKRSKLVKTFTIQSFGLDKREMDLELPTELRSFTIETFSNEVQFYAIGHLLWNLQSIIIDGWCSLPTCIWEMPQLRMLRGHGLNVNSIATDIKGKHFIVLKNLHTLGYVVDFKFAKQILDRVPNLRSLRLRYIDNEDTSKPFYYYLCNLAQLQKLERLTVQNALENITFPISLKDLVLVNCRMTWEDMSTIGLLPVLESLELGGGIEGSEWNPVEGEFARLKILIISDIGLLVSWTADSIHFPILEELTLVWLDSLEEIPLGIGDISTLRLIRLNGSSESAMKSAKQIWEEQCDMGNETLRIQIYDGYGKLTYEDGKEIDQR